MAGSADWTEAHVRRLFWRAGFGATADELRRFTAAGRDATLSFILDGERGPALAGPEPRVDGRRLDPANEYGHDVLWWLDLMVRTRRPLVEKMTLFWHDHFATLEQETPLMLAQNQKLRKGALGSFRKLLEVVTLDPAMQLFLSLADSTRYAPNENYARELMELFTLGSGYTERDIREAARALTGFTSSLSSSGQVEGVHFNAELHDPEPKQIFGRQGRFGWRDVLELVLRHPAHAPYLVGKLWSFFVTEPASPATIAALSRVYRRSKLQIKPVVAAILRHPALYANLDRPDMIKCPIVYVVGALRLAGRGIDNSAWTWLLDNMGQVPFNAPSVAGWEWGTAWLSSHTMRSRFYFANVLAEDAVPGVPDGSTPRRMSPADAIARAKAAVGPHWTSPQTDAVLQDMTARFFNGLEPDDEDGRGERADMCQRALRHIMLTGPDAQLH